MHVLHITEAHGGGVQSAISHFVRQTPAFRHTLVARARPGEDTVTAQGLEVVSLEGNLLSFLVQARRYVTDRQPDVVHMHSSFAGLLRMMLPLESVRVYSPHCYAFERQDTSAFQRLVYRLAERVLMLRTDGVIAVSPHERELAKTLREGVRVDVASNFAPLHNVPPREQHNGARVVTVGRICPQKSPGFFAAVAMMPAVKDSGIEFEWVGDGDPELKSQLERAGVTVSGWLDQATVRSRLRNSDLYLHTASWEASPMSLAEALDMDLPILCRDLPTLESLAYQCAGATVSDVGEKVTRFFREPAYQAQVGAHNSITRQMMAKTAAADVLPAAYLAAKGARAKA